MRRLADRVDPRRELNAKTVEKLSSSARHLVVKLSYFTSERFIHDALRDQADQLVDRAREEWKKSKRVLPVAISWPSEHLKSDDGKTITHAVICPLNQLKDSREAVVRRLSERTKAYGLFLLERRGDEIRALFETRHGARDWKIPLKLHGDVLVAGMTTIRDDADCIGLLWSKP